MNNMSFAVAAALFEGSLAVLAVCIGWALDRSPTSTFHLNSFDLGWGILATLPPAVFFWLCINIPWRPFTKIMQVLDDTFIPMFRQCRMIELFIIALLAGLGEEMLFRGILQTWVADKVGGPYGIGVGLCVSAAVFGLLHSVTPTYALLAAGIGLYLGVIWLATGNLLVPITSHALYDFLALMYFVQVRKPKTESKSAEDPSES
jgi:membrane protease YdiL (CAAX protease family)